MKDEKELEDKYSNVPYSEEYTKGEKIKELLKKARKNNEIKKKPKK